MKYEKLGDKLCIEYREGEEKQEFTKVQLEDILLNTKNHLTAIQNELALLLHNPVPKPTFALAEKYLSKDGSVEQQNNAGEWDIYTKFLEKKESLEKIRNLAEKSIPEIEAHIRTCEELKIS